MRTGPRPTGCGGRTTVAESIWCDDPAYRHEQGRWIQELPVAGTGVPAGAAGPHVAGGVPLRDLGLVAHQEPPRPQEAFERSPTIAVLYADDTPQQWLRARQALERVLLTATVYGVACTLRPGGWRGARMTIPRAGLNRGVGLNRTAVR